VKIVAFPFTDLVETPIGILVIKATNDAIHQVGFSDDPALLNIHPSPLTQACREQINEYFKGERTTFDLPLSQHGTSFQQSVWQALGNVKFGDTMTYLQLAGKMGDDKMIRAVANANGKNELGIIVPCHRIIGSDGSLTGYAWGLRRKQWLLDFEAKTSGKKLSLF
jgi:methylated-DNA-[protein]-cysteine S-methyltransferase